MIDREEHVNLHFVCFINVNNELYELDGRHPHPIKHSVQLQPGEQLDLLRVSLPSQNTNRIHFALLFSRLEYERGHFTID